MGEQIPATLSEVYDALKAHNITDDLAWWLACLDHRVRELNDRIDAALK